jgi:hypothetical protein
MTKDEELAIDLALEALEFFKGLALSIEEIERAEEAITAIKQARSAPVQKPDHGDELTIAYMSGVQRGKELAAQRQWVGLTDEEFEDIELGCRSTSSGKIEAMQKVEAKLRSKNDL